MGRISMMHYHLSLVFTTKPVLRQLRLVTYSLLVVLTVIETTTAGNSSNIFQLVLYSAYMTHDVQVVKTLHRPRIAW